jgi:sugar lactone lactonase YvrE
VPIQGGTQTGLASSSFASLSSADGIAVDATNVYWTDKFGGAVFKVPIAGGAKTLLAVGGSPEQIFVDATSIYWTDVSGGIVWKLTPK